MPEATVAVFGAFFFVSWFCVGALCASTVVAMLAARPLHSILAYSSRQDDGGTIPYEYPFLAFKFAILMIHTLWCVCEMTMNNLWWMVRLQTSGATMAYEVLANGLLRPLSLSLTCFLMQTVLSRMVCKMQRQVDEEMSVVVADTGVDDFARHSLTGHGHYLPVVGPDRGLSSTPVDDSIRRAIAPIAAAAPPRRKSPSVQTSWHILIRRSVVRRARPFLLVVCGIVVLYIILAAVDSRVTAGGLKPCVAFCVIGNCTGSQTSPNSENCTNHTAACNSTPSVISQYSQVVDNTFASCLTQVSSRCSKVVAPRLVDLLTMLTLGGYSVLLLRGGRRQMTAMIHSHTRKTFRSVLVILLAVLLCSVMIRFVLMLNFVRGDDGIPDAILSFLAQLVDIGYVLIVTVRLVRGFQVQEAVNFSVVEQASPTIEPRPPWST